MSKVKIKDDDTVVIKLSKDEAATLAGVLGRVGSGQGHQHEIDDLFGKLSEVGLGHGNAVASEAYTSAAFTTLEQAQAFQRFADTVESVIFGGSEL